MLRVGLQTSKGPIALVVFNEENKKRLEAGMPMVAALNDMLPPGRRFVEVVIHYAKTYSDGVEDMAQGGMPVTDELREMAKKLDDEIVSGKQ